MDHLQNILQVNDSSLLKDNLVVCSEANADGSFLLHYFLSFYARSKNCVCLLGVYQTFHHYNSVGKKLGVDYAALKKEGKFVFLDTLKEGGQYLLNAAKVGDSCDSINKTCVQEAREESPYMCVAGIPDSVSNLYKHICNQCKELQQKYPETSLLLVIDNLTLLLALGVPVKDISYLVTYLSRTLNKEGNCSVVVMVSEDGDEDTTLLIKQLRHMADLVLFTEGLPSGYCKDVHGQVYNIFILASKKGTRAVHILKIASHIFLP